MCILKVYLWHTGGVYQKNFGHKFFLESKFFFRHKIFRQEIFLDPKFFRPKFFFGPKISFGPKSFFGPKVILEGQPHFKNLKINDFLTKVREGGVHKTICQK